jgi:hypothetical protein
VYRSLVSERESPFVFELLAVRHAFEKEAVQSSVFILTTRETCSNIRVTSLKERENWLTQLCKFK